MFKVREGPQIHARTAKDFLHFKRLNQGQGLGVVFRHIDVNQAMASKGGQFAQKTKGNGLIIGKERTNPTAITAAPDHAIATEPAMAVSGAWETMA